MPQDSKKMTLEELEAIKKQGNMPFDLLLDWAAAKADSLNKETPAPKQDDTEQHEINILDD